MTGMVRKVYLNNPISLQSFTGVKVEDKHLSRNRSAYIRYSTASFEDLEKAAVEIAKVNQRNMQFGLRMLVGGEQIPIGLRVFKRRGSFQTEYYGIDVLIDAYIDKEGGSFLGRLFDKLLARLSPKHKHIAEEYALSTYWMNFPAIIFEPYERAKEILSET